MQKKTIALLSVLAVIVAVVFAVFFQAKKTENPGASSAGSAPAVNSPSVKPHDGGPQVAYDSNEMQSEASPPQTKPHASSFATLPAENSYLRDGGLDMDVAEARITGKDFSKYIDALEIEMQRDPNASELRNLYKSEIEKLFKRSKVNPKNSRFACGTTLCIGSFVEEKGQNWHGQWEKEFDKNPTTPHTLSTSYTVEIGDGETEYRYLFTTDPAASEVITRNPTSISPKTTPTR